MEEPEEDDQVTITPLDEGQHAFISLVQERYRGYPRLGNMERTSAKPVRPMPIPTLGTAGPRPAPFST